MTGLRSDSRGAVVPEAAAFHMHATNVVISSAARHVQFLKIPIVLKSKIKCPEADTRRC